MTLAIEILRLSLWLLLLAVLFLPLERLFALHPQKVLRRGIGVDIAYYFLSSLLPGLLLAVPFSLLAVAAHHVMPYPVQSAVVHSPVWLKVAASFLMGEIGFYWGHRWSHEVPLLWRFHAIHHSPGHMDFLVNTRAHPVDLVFMRLVGLTPLYIVGLANPMTASGNLLPLLVTVVAAIWGFFIHANIRWRLGPLEWLVATPAFHHWHHALAEPWNRNYASTLPWLDHLFRTHHLPRDAWPEAYGIVQHVPSSLYGQMAHPLRRVASPEAVDSCEPVDSCVI